MGDWPSGKAVPLHGKKRGFKSLIAHKVSLYGNVSFVQAGFSRTWSDFKHGCVPSRQGNRSGVGRPCKKRFGKSAACCYQDKMAFEGALKYRLPFNVTLKNVLW